VPVPTCRALLSFWESLAQYSALMVMEKEYGRDIMRKFLRYEIENYLRSRGRDRLAPGLRLEHP
jgi:hypothetical protein